jgi:hypothetical protein
MEEFVAYLPSEADDEDNGVLQDSVLNGILHVVHLIGADQVQ